ncbi:pyridoxamine 5'-phosphate oxidase family protein [Sphingobium nicotianae]|uniref:Pyridoxamine 5'-phosphate oxidase family protein n=1 Tax=Sphingobium nicotianae TaxID=2782607 RepID=A0A9X1ISF5_9SPHN|nr:pyridoxamine 5'-phosphate oxidase family protein [Sphingobium nicotianae]MBT2188115.1 pyridoxamine 5'-phosphate oxidase family protein [Sphingobium nicotianae]
MSAARREVLIGAVLAGIAAGAERAQASAPVPEHYRTVEPAAMIAAANALIARDMFTTLITVDAENRPRARTVLVSAPDEDFTLWMATRPGTRKLEQIAHNHTATLHFADDASAAYASLMGEARMVSDPALIASRNPYKGQALKQFFPDFPRDFVLLAFRPAWLEITTASIPSTTDTWRPQGLTIG